MKRWGHKDSQISAVLIVAVMVCGQRMIQAQDLEQADLVTPAASSPVPPELPAMPKEWVHSSLDWVSFQLQAHPPSLSEDPLRRTALSRLDDVLHIQAAPQDDSVASYYRDRLSIGLHLLELPRPSDGFQVIKMYNAGVIVRTPSVTLGFDVITNMPGSKEELTDAQVTQLASRVDVLFVSHQHKDHADLRLAKEAVRLGKAVIVPGGLWKGDIPNDAKLISPDRQDDQETSLTLAGARTIRIKVIPGWQTSSLGSPAVANNIYDISTPEGLRLVHTGDQHSGSGFAGDRVWARSLAMQHVDLLMVDAWYVGLSELVNTISPRIFLPGHEDELGHAILHRENYSKTYTALADCKVPFVVMTWGESFILGPSEHTTSK